MNSFIFIHKYTLYLEIYNCYSLLHQKVSLCVVPGGVLPYQNGGGVPPEPHGTPGEIEIKKFRVTKRQLLNNLSNIYKCKVSPGGTFSLGNFLFSERENYQI